MNTRKLFVAASAVSMIMFGGGIARAQSRMGQMGEEEGRSSTDTKKTMERSTSLPESEQRTLTLTVKHVDPKNHRMTFDAMVSPEASLEKSGRTIRLDQLKPGDSVRASFDPATKDVIKVEVLKKGTGAEGGAGGAGGAGTSGSQGGMGEQGGQGGQGGSGSSGSGGQ